MTPTITPEAARLAEEAKRLARQLSSSAYSQGVADERDSWKQQEKYDKQARDQLAQLSASIDALAALAKQDAAPTSAARNVGDDLRKLRFVYRVLNNFAEAPQSDRADAYVMVRELIESTWKSGAAPTSASTVPADPELTSSEVNDACWAWLNAMPDGSGAYEGRIFNNLKPAIHAAICRFLAELRDPAYPPGACSVTDGEAKK